MRSPTKPFATLLSLLAGGRAFWDTTTMEELQRYGLGSDAFYSFLLSNSRQHENLIYATANLLVIRGNELIQNFPCAPLKDDIGLLDRYVRVYGFFITVFALQTFVKKRWKNILRFLLFELKHESPVGFYLKLSPENDKQAWFANEALSNSKTAIEATVISHYQMPIRKFCVCYFSMNLGCNNCILDAFIAHYPKDLKACFQ